jgi:hypothetical protein
MWKRGSHNALRAVPRFIAPPERMTAPWNVNVGWAWGSQRRGKCNLSTAIRGLVHVERTCCVNKRLAHSPYREALTYSLRNSEIQCQFTAMYDSWFSDGPVKGPC